MTNHYHDISVDVISTAPTLLDNAFSLLCAKLRSRKQRPRPSLMATASDSGHSFVHRVSQYGNECIREIHYGGTLYGVLLLDENHVLVAGTGDFIIKKFSISENKVVQNFKKHTDTVIFLVRVDQNRFASCSGDKTVVIWDLETGKSTTMKGHSNNVYIMCKINDKYLASGSEDKTIIIWDVEQAKSFKTLTGHSGNICTIAKVDEKKIASGGSDKTVRVWDYKSGKTLLVIKQEGWVGCVLPYDKNTFFISDNVRRIKRWKVDDNYENLKMEQEIATCNIDCMYRWSDREIMVGGENGFVAILDW